MRACLRVEERYMVFVYGSCLLQCVFIYTAIFHDDPQVGFRVAIVAGNLVAHAEVAVA